MNVLIDCELLKERCLYMPRTTVVAADYFPSPTSQSFGVYFPSPEASISAYACPDQKRHYEIGALGPQSLCEPQPSFFAGYRMFCAAFEVSALPAADNPGQTPMDGSIQLTETAQASYPAI